MPSTRSSRPKASSNTSPSAKDELKPKPKIKKVQPSSDLQKALANLKKANAQCQKLNLSGLKDLDKDLKRTFEKTKRETQKFEQERTAAKPSRTRSGMKRGANKVVNQQKSVYTEGKWILKGMDDARDKFDQDELEYLEKSISKIKVVGNLDYDHLKYLVVYVHLDELKAIKQGETPSPFHDRWEKLSGKCQHELQSEIKTTLFTNEQRDYISGMLQELFDANKKDDNGDIRHTEINYVMIVMLAEAITRIVKHIHNFASLEETIEFMKKSSREAHGISSDEEE